METLAPPMARPWIIGHRGVTVGRAENTLAAFEAALEGAADGIELDLQLTRDGVPVVFHHRTLFRAGLRGRRVFHLDLAAVRRLRVRCGPGCEPGEIPTLEEVLDHFGGRTRLFLEVKARPRVDTRERHRELAAKVAEAVVRRGLEGSVCILSFEREVLEACCGAAPGLRTCLNLKRRLALDGAATRGLFALCLAVRHLTPEYAAAVHGRGLALFTYTCNGPRTVRRALAARVDAILTGRPAWAAAYLDRLGVGR
ncbi:MAG: glycerophosphodiester phosphodiesterase [Nitrospirae bacterium]|nr:MAG: glycerophosphodiester phosphodiesterase [Nitrospirota bacterium]